ncbi:MAG: hypothetical protein CMH22_16075 [Methylophaga sp.]|nr:hypothetical protein [Methylophaga sp.]MAX53494.1 hypothetical protein [Methylophaga sp.]
MFFGRIHVVADAALEFGFAAAALNVAACEAGDGVGGHNIPTVEDAVFEDIRQICPQFLHSAL